MADDAADTDAGGATDPPSTEATRPSGATTGDGDERVRSVVVPDRVYKTVTVFSTLFAVVAVVAGFVVLDEATDRASVALSEVDPLLALLGVGLIVAGAVTYAFSTRFRAEGMGNAKGDTDEPSNNG